MKKFNLSIEKKSYGVREAIRTLRTNLQFCGDDKRVILVTSCVPREGKSSVSVALAESIADMGKSVILVDADIRNSVMASKLQITGADKGLSHWQTTLLCVRTGKKNLSVLQLIPVLLC